MARRAAPKRSAAKKKPAKRKGTTAARKASYAKGKPRAASTRSARAPTKTPGAQPSSRIEVRNVNVPGYRNTVDAAKYGAMRSSLFSALPGSPPGLTQAEMLEAVLPKLSQEHFPRGEKAMWWIKTVQLDQEARGAMKRSATKPLRWWRTA